MAEPIFSATLERLYRRLPEFIRLEDPDTGYATKRYLSLVVDQLGAIEVLLDRIDYVTVPDGGAAGDTSELVDPAKADAAWLPWLAQLVGVSTVGRTTPQVRASIAAASGNYDVGSARALLAAIKGLLASPQRAALQRDVDGSMWKLGVVINPADIQTVSWDNLETTFPDWSTIQAASTWDGLGASDPLSSAVVAGQKPAGVVFVALDPGDWAVVEGLGSWTAIEALGSWDSLAAAPF